MIRTGKVKVAAVQTLPVLPMNKKATVEKACSLIEEAGNQGAELIVFPEGFIPMFPNWSMDMQIENEWSDLLTEMILNSIEIPGEETKALGGAAQKAGAYVCMGCNEIMENYVGVLYNSLVFLGPDGNVISHHRKLTPSHRERVVHARGNAEDLFHVVETRIGRIGGLICYEHLQPLFKYALMTQGEQIHCACWAGWPGFPPPGRSNFPIGDFASRAYAIEAACFVVLAAPWVPPDLRAKYDKEGYAGMKNAHWGFIGGSGVINPVGEYIAGPLVDDEGIVYAEIDLMEITKRKCYIDPVGKDSRWDVIRLDTEEGHFSPYVTGFPKIKNESQQAVTYSNKKESEKGLLNDLNAQIKKLSKEIENLKADK
jgi:predicted amidohydrolase